MDRRKNSSTGNRKTTRPHPKATTKKSSQTPRRSIKMVIKWSNK